MGRGTKALFVFLVLGIAVTVLAVHPVWSGKGIGIYAGPGSWTEDRIALKNFFAAQGLVSEEFSSFENLNKFSLLILSGGWSGDYLPIQDKTRDALKTFVAQGGRIIGICAGAYVLSREIIWLGERYVYGFGIFEGTSKGPLAGLADWPQFTFTSIRSIKTSDAYARVLYFGGQEFRSSQDAEVIAYWAHNNTPAALTFLYGQGKVLLLGFHPEMGFDYQKSGWDTEGKNGAAWPWLGDALRAYGFLSGKRKMQ